MFTKLLSEFKNLIILIVIFLICMGGIAIGAYLYGKHVEEKQYQLLLNSKSELTQELAVAENKTKSIEKLLEEKSLEAEQLRASLVAMQEKPADVKYIVKTKTILKKGVPYEFTITVPKECESTELPTHIYRLDVGLPVARFYTNTEEEKVTLHHETATLTFTEQTIVTEEKTGHIINATSSLEPDKSYQIKVEELETIRVRDWKIFEPHIALILSGSLDTVPLGMDVSAGIALPLIHLLDRQLDVVAPKITVGDEEARLGIEVISYNIGHDLPVITDTWLSLGTSIPLRENSTYIPSVDFSISSKF